MLFFFNSFLSNFAEAFTECLHYDEAQASRLDTYCLSLRSSIFLGDVGKQMNVVQCTWDVIRVLNEGISEKKNSEKNEHSLGTNGHAKLKDQSVQM